MRKGRRLIPCLIVLGVATCAGSLELSTTSQDSVVLSPMGSDFGTVDVGQTSGSATFTVSPQSTTGSDAITSISFDQSCPSFLLDTPNLVPNTGSGGSGSIPIYYDCVISGSGSGTMSASCTPVTYTFYAAFQPQFAGSFSCPGHVYTNSTSGGSGVPFTLTGIGRASSFAMDIKPTYYDFGTISTTGTSHGVDITVTNTGAQDLNLSAMASGSPYSLSTSFINPLSAGSAATFTVTCSLPSPGANPGNVMFSTAEGPMGMTTLDCEGVTTSVSVDAIDFGTELVGGARTNVPVTFHNDGTASVTISGFAIQPDVPAGQLALSPPSPSTVLLQPGGQFTAFNITYSPDSEFSTGQLGKLAFSDGMNNLSVPISGDALLGAIGGNPEPVAFGAVCAGGVASMNVVVQTTGAAPVDVNGLTAPGAPFGATSVDDVQTLGGNGAGAVHVTVLASPPATATPGDVTDKFSLATNIPQTPARNFPITATVLAPGATPTPGKLSFGSVANGETSAGQKVTVTNCGAPVTITDARLTGSAPEEYSIESPANAANLNKMLGNGESQMFLVQMTPHTSGDKTATLLVELANGDFKEVPLDGTGFGDTGSGSGSNKDRETYYACGVGRAAPAWPIALAVLLVLRRRRG